MMPVKDRQKAKEFYLRLGFQVVVEAPGLGDGVQAIKSGLLEVGDIVVVNKADTAGAKEALRVLRPGGVIAVSVWATDERLDPFDAFAEALQRDATAAGSGRTISNASVATTVHGIVDQLLVAGAAEVRATRQELAVRWPTVDSEIAALFGTPFGPFLDSLPGGRRDGVLADVRQQLDRDGHTATHLTTSVLGRGVKR